MRLGVSAYPADEEAAEDLFARAAGYGASMAFTSMHLPEDSPARARAAITVLGRAARTHGLELVCDVSPRTRDLLGDDPWATLARAGVDRLRLDDGFGPDEVAQVLRHLPVARNASTEGPPGCGPAGGARGTGGPVAGDVLGVHNFYPRRGTGLALATVGSSAQAWHAVGLRVGAFVSGDARRRGPLGDGLPTVEDHRDRDPAAQAASLLAVGCDVVLVGDPGIGPDAAADLARLVRDDVITLRLDARPDLPDGLLTAVLGDDEERRDPAAQQVRLARSRARLGSAVLPASGGEPRPRGSVTVDLGTAGRYRGEVRVTRVDLPPDPTVAVLGRVPERWWPALDAVRAASRVHLAVAGPG
jgi:uncharacterized protein